MRGISLSGNRLTAASAEAFGDLLAGGYEVSAAQMEKRSATEAKLLSAAGNKAHGHDVPKRKKDPRNEARPLLCEVFREEGGKLVAGANKSLAALNLCDNPGLGSGEAVLRLLTRLVEARRQDRVEPGSTELAVTLRELHLRRSFGGRDPGGGEEVGGGEPEDRSELITAASRALAPTVVHV